MQIIFVHPNGMIAGRVDGTFYVRNGNAERHGVGQDPLGSGASPVIVHDHTAVPVKNVMLHPETGAIVNADPKATDLPMHAQVPTSEHFKMHAPIGLLGSADRKHRGSNE